MAELALDLAEKGGCIELLMQKANKEWKHGFQRTHRMY